LTYGEARKRARRVAAALLERRLSTERPLAVLSGNDIEHALLELAAMYSGVPYAPVSPAYSLVSTDFAQLRRVIELITPGLIFVSQRNQFQRAIDAACRGIEVIDSLPEREADAEVEAAHARVGPDAIAKFLFTSGSIEATVRNLREVAPNWYFTVPKGYEMLLPHLKADPALRQNFFSRLKALWFAGAGVSQHVFDEYKALAYETCGEQILFLTGLG